MTSQFQRRVQKENSAVTLTRLSASNGLVHGVLAMTAAQVDDRITAEVGISLVGSSARRRAQFEARTQSPRPGDNTLRTVFGVRRVGTFERIKVAKIQVMQGGKA